MTYANKNAKNLIFVKCTLQNSQNIILHTHDYGYFTKMYYLCIEFQKRHKITKNF